MNEPGPRNAPFWPRLTRRAFFGGAGAAGAGLVLGAPLASPAFAENEGGDAGDPNSRLFSISVSPNEIGHVNAVIEAGFGNKVHFFFPGPVEGTAHEADPEGAHPNGRDPSLIYDFRGMIGQADLTNIHGTGTNLDTGAHASYTFHTDMRFMKGDFIASDGRRHRGAFAFI
jgi:hypothetical protein